MNKIKHLAKLYVIDTSGVTAIEYGLIAGAMGLMLIPTMTLFSSTVQTSLFDVMVGLF
jgi:Flp pilus assembly pilin Flp